MRFTILGSGGCCSLPRPGCFCRVCEEARSKGQPYARFGPSLYLWDARLLVDTPEDIVHALNYSRVPDVERVLYTHPDPDHTMGMRLFEQLRLDWFLYASGGRCEAPVDGYALPGAMRFLRNAGCGYGSSLAYYEQMGIARFHEADSLIVGDIEISLVSVGADGRVSVIAFRQAERKLVYAPCDCMPFPEDERLYDADALVLGNTMHGSTFRNGYTMSEDMAARYDLYTPEAARALAGKLRAKRLVFTHLEEDWNLSYGDYARLEAETPGVTYAFDGMTLDI